MKIITCHKCRTSASHEGAQCPNDVIQQTGFIQDDYNWSIWYCPWCVNEQTWETALDRFEAAVKELSWIGSLDPADHKAVEEEYQESRKELIKYLKGGNKK